MRLFVIIVLVIFAPSLGSGQPKLRQSIGVNSLPRDSESICPLGSYSTDPTNVGLSVGDTAFDFTLYDVSGNPTSLSEILSRGKPVMLVDGSYTCGIFRSYISSINDIVSMYGQRITTLLIYTAEAHPNIDPSLYPGPEEAAADSANRAAHILYRQPKNYAERKSIARDMQNATFINAPILLDAPCNQWFLTYGPAPNIAYIIDTHGIIRYKEPWFNYAGLLAWNDIDALLNNTAASEEADTGIVSFRITTNDTIYTTTGRTVALGGLLVNQTDEDAIILIDRSTGPNMPEGWETSICTNVCLNSYIDSSVVTVAAHSTQDVTIYFYVGAAPGTGSVFLHLANKNVSSNTFDVSLACVASAESDVRSAQNLSRSLITIVPNPVSSLWSIYGANTYTAIRIYDMLGRIVFNSNAAGDYPSSSLAQGIYRVQLLSPANVVVGETTLVKQ